MFRKSARILLITLGLAALGGGLWAIIERKAKDPVLTPAAIEEIRIKQVAWLRMEPGCSIAKAEVDKLVAKHTPAGYVISDGPEGLKLVKAPPPEKGKK